MHQVRVVFHTIFEEQFPEPCLLADSRVHNGTQLVGISSHYDAQYVREGGRSVEVGLRTLSSIVHDEHTEGRIAKFSQLRSPHRVDGAEQKLRPRDSGGNPLLTEGRHVFDRKILILETKPGNKVLQPRFSSCDIL